jgi:hypothetical protein
LTWPLCAALAACTQNEETTARISATDLVDGRINTTVFECRPAGVEPFEFTVRRGAAELALWLPQSFDRAYQVLSEEYVGTTFTGLYREGDVSVDLADASVELGVGGQRFTGCRENRLRSVWEHAKLSGVNFRATGEDPAWYLEIREGDRMEFRSSRDAGTLRLPMSGIALETNADGARYRAAPGGVAFTVEIDARPCRVADGLGLTGVTVVVTAGGSDFQGCGRPLH